MAAGDRPPSWGRRIVLLVLLGAAVWLFVRAWNDAASPGRDEVLAAYVAASGLTPGDVPEEPLGLVERWADEQPDLAIQVGDWEYRAGLAPPAAGAAWTDIGPDERFVLVFLAMGDLEERYRGRYYLSGKPVTPFASLRLYVKEIGREMRIPDPRRWDDWGGWDPPDR